MTPDELRSLLEEDESAYLEFKEKIDLATKEGKAGFLKEVLALANSSHHPSFLIIGVRDKTKDLVGVKGISEEQLQQIVGRYCKPPIPLSYEVVEYNGVTIGVVQILRSNFKPHTLKTRFGYQDSNGRDQEIRESQVFIRRGSIIDEATREELIAIAQDRDSDTELMARAVSGIEKIGSRLPDISHNLEELVEQSRWNRFRDDSDPMVEAIFVSILTGGIAGGVLKLDSSFLPVAVPLLWYVVSMVASGLGLLRPRACRSAVNAVVLGFLLSLAFVLVDSSQILRVLSHQDPLLGSVVAGAVLGVVTGVLGTVFLWWAESRMQ